MQKILCALLGMLVLVATPTLAAQIKGTWGGAAATDPLHGSVDWEMIDTSICWVGRPPAGYQSRSYQIKVTNKSAQAGWLEVDGSQVDVVKPAYAGQTAAPRMILVNIDGVEYRKTALFPQETCYLAAPGKSRKTAEEDGWKVSFHVAEPLRGMNGTWTPVTGSTGGLMGYLFSGGFESFGACELDRVKYRGKRMPVVFQPTKLEDYNDGC